MARKYHHVFVKMKTSDKVGYTFMLIFALGILSVCLYMPFNLESDPNDPFEPLWIAILWVMMLGLVAFISKMLIWNNILSACTWAELKGRKIYFKRIYQSKIREMRLEELEKLMVLRNSKILFEAGHMFITKSASFSVKREMEGYKDFIRTVREIIPEDKYFNQMEGMVD